MNDAVPAPAPKKSRNRLKAFLLLALVFFLGMAAGVGITGVITVKRLQASLRNPAAVAGPATRFIDRVERDLTKRLDLTASEQAAVREELETSRGKLMEIRSGLRGQARELVEDSLVRIAKRLPEGKREALRLHVKERLRPWGLGED